MVTVKENPRVRYNYKDLMEQQEELEQEYKDQIAHPCPDSRSEFNENW